MTQIVKRLSAPYLIKSADIAISTIVAIGDNVANTASVTINGNLFVVGTTHTVAAMNSSVASNLIVLNTGETGAGVTAGTSGVVVDRGTLANVAVLWNEGVKRWQLTNDGSLYANISTIGTGSYISSVVEDLSPHLGGNLVTGNNSMSYNITSLPGTNLVLSPNVYLQVDGTIQLQHVAPPTASVVGYTLVHGGNVAGGSTGAYITNGTEINQELIAKNRAIVYSLIF